MWEVLFNQRGWESYQAVVVHDYFDPALADTEKRWVNWTAVPKEYPCLAQASQMIVPSRPLTPARLATVVVNFVYVEDARKLLQAVGVSPPDRQENISVSMMIGFIGAMAETLVGIGAVKSHRLAERAKQFAERTGDPPEPPVDILLGTWEAADTI